MRAREAEGNWRGGRGASFCGELSGTEGVDGDSVGVRRGTDGPPERGGGSGTAKGAIGLAAPSSASAGCGSGAARTMSHGKLAVSPSAR